MKKYIRSNTTVPEEFTDIFDVYSDQEYGNLIGLSAEELENCKVENLNTGGPEFKHVAWLVAKPEYEKALASSGYEDLELISGLHGPFLGYIIRGRLYDTVHDVTDEVWDIVNEFDAREYYKEHPEEIP